MMSGLMGTVAQGMAFGTGSAIAHRAVGAVAGSMMGGNEEQPEVAQASQQPQSSIQSCEYDQKNFYDCLQSNHGDVNSCDMYFQQLQACQAQAKQFA